MEAYPFLRFSLIRSASVRRISASSYRCLHTSSPKRATPLPHPSAPAPPPRPPVPSTSEVENRLDRKRAQAELLRQGKPLRPDSSGRASPLQKRFWKEVSVEETPDGYNILLDKRPVRTASKAVLSIPPNKHQLAAAIALEWDLLVSAQQALKQHYIPLTSLASRAMDIQMGDREGKSSMREDVVKMLLRYLSTDTLLCWAPDKGIHEGPIEEQRDVDNESLRKLQMRAAKPIIAHLTRFVWPGVEIVPTMDPNSIIPKPQPAETIEIVRGWLSGLPAFELAGLERAVLAGKSLLVGVRLLVEWSQEFAHLRAGASDSAEQRFGIEEAAEACSLEVRWQTEMWGEVEDTHDVDKEDLRRQLGSVVVLVNG